MLLVPALAISPVGTEKEHQQQNKKCQPACERLSRALRRVEMIVVGRRVDAASSAPSRCLARRAACAPDDPRGQGLPFPICRFRASNPFDRVMRDRVPVAEICKQRR
jgi:hypothetical protein